MALILVRHSRPVGFEGLCYGRTDLLAGPEVGDDAARLNTELPKAKRLITSPLVRAEILAKTLGEIRNTPVTQDNRLVEMDFGHWEGKLWADIPRNEIDAWAADFLNARPHGGESVKLLEARVSQVLNSYEDAILVTHLGVIRAALSIAEHKAAWEAKVGFGEAIHL